MWNITFDGYITGQKSGFALQVDLLKFVYTQTDNSSHPEGIYGGLVLGVPAYIKTH